MTAPPPGKMIDASDDRPALSEAGASRLTPVPPPPGPALSDFRGGEETRLRDLLAFAMAVEAGRPLPPDGIESLRRRADAELEGHAFRVLHNQVEAIRRQAVEEERGRLRRGLSFPGAVVANLVALALAAGAILAVPQIDPGFFTRMADQIAQLFAQITSRF